MVGGGVGGWSGDVYCEGGRVGEWVYTLVILVKLDVGCYLVVGRG